MTQDLSFELNLIEDWDFFNKIFIIITVSYVAKFLFLFLSSID
jgi:hypothetical protein